jgi:large subunit ribosomal protein L31
MPKSDIHPKWFENTPVLCDGKPLCLIGSTKRELQVDIWLANHPFYTNSQVMIDSEGRVEKFMKKYRLIQLIIIIYLKLIYKILCQLFNN